MGASGTVSESDEREDDEETGIETATSACCLMSLLEDNWGSGTGVVWSSWVASLGLLSGVVAPEVPEAPEGTGVRLSKVRCRQIACLPECA